MNWWIEFCFQFSIISIEFIFIEFIFIEFIFIWFIFIWFRVRNCGWNSATWTLSKRKGIRCAICWWSRRILQHLPSATNIHHVRCGLPWNRCSTAWTAMENLLVFHRSSCSDPRSRWRRPCSTTLRPCVATSADGCATCRRLPSASSGRLRN